MIEWEKVPWSLWVFAALNLPAAVLIEIEASGSIQAKVLFPVFLGAWFFLLLKGLRWVWLGTLWIFVLGFAADLATSSFHWQSFAIGLIGPVLLLLPVSRRYFAKEESV